MNFEINDNLDREQFAKKLEQIIEVQQEFEKESCVVSLNGSYGTGKTHFLQMWKHRLENPKIDSFSEDNNNKQLVVYLNAWDTNFSSDPFLAIMFQISQVLDSMEPSSQIDEIRSLISNVGLFRIRAGKQFVRSSIGIDVDKFIRAPETLFDKERSRVQLVKKTQELLNKICQASSCNRILIMVDELDRCRPSHAVEFLETIKHLFNLKGLTFLLAVDREQLEGSAKHTFGHNLNFEEYLRKFVHLEICLPPVSTKSYSTLCDEYIKKYLQNGRDSIVLKFDVFQEAFTNLLEAVQLTPRQLQNIFRTLTILAKTTGNKTLNKGYAYSILIMLVIKLLEPRLYQSLGTESATIKSVASFLLHIKDDSTRVWWFGLLAQAGQIKDHKGNILSFKSDKHQDEVIEDISGVLELETLSRAEALDYLHRIASSPELWGYNPPYAPYLYKLHGRIEEWERLL